MLYKAFRYELISILAVRLESHDPSAVAASDQHKLCSLVFNEALKGLTLALENTVGIPSQRTSKESQQSQAQPIEACNGPTQLSRKSHQSEPKQMEDSTAAEEKEAKNLPPTVITVDTGAKKEEEAEDDGGSHDNRPSTKNETETRTPKHANKSLAAAATSAVVRAKEAAKPNTTEARQSGAGTAAHPPQSQAFFAPRPYEGNLGGPTGAFQPRERLTRQHNQLMAMQVSPGATHYYGNYPQGHGGPGHPAQYPPYEQHGQRPEYAHRPHPNMQFYPQYPGHPYPQRRGPPPPGWGPHGPYHSRPPPNYPGQHPGGMHGGYQGGPPNSANTFSRAVSSSFDRSVKSRDSRDRTEQLPANEAHHMMAPPPPANDDRSLSEDGSWRQLNQIQSVDEDEMRKRLTKTTTPKAAQEGGMKQPASNSSSLTNSPTDEVEAAAIKKDNIPEPPKMTSSLDSLSSVASTQAPLAVKKDKSPVKDDKPLSPTDSAAASLDLMKCASGSSHLLLPSHQRSLSQFSFEGSGTKRAMEEVREGGAASEENQESRGTEPAEDRPSKRSRPASEATNDKKASPLSIACSPQNTCNPKEEVGKPYSYPPTSKDSLYDKPPMYSYSIDSAPAMPGEDNRGGEHGYPSLPARSHSSASSTIPPMPPLGDPGNERDRHPGVSQLPSWEIQGQDSFGGHSTSNALVGTFSFAQEYPPLSRNNSMLSHHGEIAMPPKHPYQGGPVHYHHPHHSHDRGHVLESRNQSFEGGHYHGSFSRADTMSFESRTNGVPDARQGYHQPHYPPHAPSWGSQGSYAPPMHNYVPAYRAQQMHPGMMRSFSHDSCAPPSFQPPSEFQAPPTNLNKNRPRTEKHIMTTPFVASKSGVFGWTKEEDMRLTEIMKRHKNPRDWEPIAKELDRGRNAKECHERWIRYLKPGVRKGQWTDQEDAIVMEAVTNSKEQPFTRWSDLAQRLPGRVGKQIRDRWVNHLNPNINHLPFSREDDLLLWEGHKKLGKRWVEIATSFFKSTRSENHIKNRWYSASFKKFISNEFGPNAYSGSKPGRPTKKEPSKKKGKSPARNPGSDDSSIPAVGV